MKNGRVEVTSRGYKLNNYTCVSAKCGHKLYDRPIATEFVICPRCQNFMKRDDGKMVFIR